MSELDVVVPDAGSPGTTAAIVAARAGAPTLLLDGLRPVRATSTALLGAFSAFFLAPGRTRAPGPRRPRLRPAPGHAGTSVRRRVLVAPSATARAGGAFGPEVAR